MTFICSSDEGPTRTETSCFLLKSLELKCHACFRLFAYMYMYTYVKTMHMYICMQCIYVYIYRIPPTDKTRVVSTRRRVPTNWVSGRTLQPSIESVVANSFVPSDFLVDGQVSGLRTVHPLLTLSFVSTWILPLHVVSSTLKRKSSSSVMDGLQRRYIYI